MNELVYSMTSRVVAMEVRNYSDVVISGTEDSEELRNKFTDEILFILDDQQMVHQLEFSAVKKPVRVVFHNYTKFDLRAVIDNDWSSCHIGTETLVYNEITYRAIPDGSKLPKKEKAHFWKLRKSFGETNAGKHDYEHWQVKGSRQLSGMIAYSMGRDRKGARFDLLPSPASRKIHMIAGYHRQLIHRKMFATNNHILIQFEVTYKLSDETQIGRKTWSELKHEVLNNEQAETALPLDEEEEKVLAGLINAQRKANELETGKVNEMKELRNEKLNIRHAIVMKMNRMIITQKKEIQTYLDSNIIGESHLKDGMKYLTVMHEDEVVLLRFSRQGRAKIVRKIPNFVKTLD